MSLTVLTDGDSLRSNVSHPGERYDFDLSSHEYSEDILACNLERVRHLERPL